VNCHDLCRDRREVFEDGQYSTELFAREAVPFIRDNGSTPFFLYVPFNSVHYPMHEPKKYFDRFPQLEVVTSKITPSEIVAEPVDDVRKAPRLGKQRASCGGVWKNLPRVHELDMRSARRS
jgi:hypothetical protein